jgi:hypothetical protein
VPGNASQAPGCRAYQAPVKGRAMDREREYRIARFLLFVILVIHLLTMISEAAYGLKVNIEILF